MYIIKNCKISIPPIKAAINPGTFHVEKKTSGLYKGCDVYENLHEGKIVLYSRLEILIATKSKLHMC